MSDYPATFTGHTPSGPTNCCVKHARQIESLMRMLGAHVNFTKAPDGAQCDNCLNTSAKPEAPQPPKHASDAANPWCWYCGSSEPTCQKPFDDVPCRRSKQGNGGGL